MFNKVKTTIVTLSLISGMAVFYSGCAVKSGNEKLENVENKDVSKMLVKGSTTKQGLVDLFGQPQATDFMQDGRQKWQYTFVAKREKGINYVPVVNWFTRGTNDEIKSLVVLLKNDIVDDYIFTKSEGETKAGAFN